MTSRFRNDKDCCTAQDSNFLAAGLSGFDPLERKETTYAVRLFPLQSQENRHAF